MCFFLILIQLYVFSKQLQRELKAGCNLLFYDGLMLMKMKVAPTEHIPIRDLSQ